jgi:hypothetical protein
VAVVDVEAGDDAFGEHGQAAVMTDRFTRAR